MDGFRENDTVAWLLLLLDITYKDMLGGPTLLHYFITIDLGCLTPASEVAGHSGLTSGHQIFSFFFSLMKYALGMSI
jgi:hypothetical protein